MRPAQASICFLVNVGVPFQSPGMDADTVCRRPDFILVLDVGVDPKPAGAPRELLGNADRRDSADEREILLVEDIVGRGANFQPSAFGREPDATIREEVALDSLNRIVLDLGVCVGTIASGQ